MLFWSEINKSRCLSEMYFTGDSRAVKLDRSNISVINQQKVCVYRWIVYFFSKYFCTGNCAELNYLNKCIKHLV